MTAQRPAGRLLRRCTVAILSATPLASPVATAQGLKADGLTIRATGFSHARGHAIAKIFVPGDNVRGPARWQISASIQNRAAAFHLPGLPPGTYAAVVFHDENNNGILDHGLIGPLEPIGFSGGFVLNLTSGMPTFERLKFEFSPPAQTLEVRVR